MHDDTRWKETLQRASEVGQGSVAPKLQNQVLAHYLELMTGAALDVLAEIEAHQSPECYDPDVCCGSELKALRDLVIGDDRAAWQAREAFEMRKMARAG